MKNIAPAISPPKGIGDRSSQNQAVLDWVHEVELLTKPDNIFWCDGSEREHRVPPRSGNEAGRLDQAQREKSSALVFASLESERRRAGRAVHFHLHADKRGSGTDEQLERAGRDLFKTSRAAQRRDARTHHVCHSLHHGAARFAADQGRVRNHRFNLRRAQHANHDPDGRDRGEDGSGTIRRRNGTAGSTHY